jgi:hypothetical protein
VGEQAGPDFFVSYTSTDATRAKWIVTELERAGYTTVSQVQDFHAGRDFVHEMHRAVASAKRTIAVLSPAYLASKFAEAEWRAAFADDPSGERGKLVLVKVHACQPPGLLRARVHIDLVGVDRDTARRRLLDGVRPAGRSLIYDRVPFPGTGRGKQRLVTGLAAVTVLLVALATGTAWALSSPSPLPGRPSAAGEPTPVAEPAVEVAATTEPAPTGPASSGIASGAPVAAVPRARSEPDQPPIDVPPLPRPISPVKISTKSLPRITVGEGWSTTLEVTGGVAPYQWSIVEGSPPEGLAVRSDGLLAGTATIPKEATLTVSVNDARGEQATRQFVMSPIPRIGDINEDGPVNCTDLNLLQSDWGKTGSDLRGDLNDDGTVDLTDMSKLLSHWTGDRNSSAC